MYPGSNIYSEVYAFLNLLGEDYIKKLPEGMYELFLTKRNKEYELKIESNRNITEQFKYEETSVIISALNLYFFCDDEERKRLVQIYTENDKKGIDISFKNIEQNSTSTFDKDKNPQNELKVIERENILKRILKKIKSLFKR